ncbi:MAG: tail fiber domain-containing protein [Bacteroidota bacterium]
MKKLVLIILMMAQFGFSQVGINTTTPNAQLDIQSSNQVTPSNTDGILIPKIDAFPLTNPTALQQGMMVYLTTISAGKQPGFYYWDNVTVNWIGLGGSAASSGWETTGNLGTNPAVNFVGTTDNNDLIFKRNSIGSGVISLYNTAFGNNVFTSNTTGNINTAFGSFALSSNTIGNSNTAVGTGSLGANTTGNWNTSVGADNMNLNNGSANVAVGSFALQSNVSGNYNTAVGTDALLNTTGSDNIALGFQAGLSNESGNSNIMIGNGTSVPNLNGSFQMSIGEVIYGADMSTTALGKIGIGVPVPTEKLEVAGKTKTTDLQVTTGAVAGNVLTSDALGNATWQAPNAGNSWSINGNSNINPNTNFIGTTNNIEVFFRMGNQISGVIGASDTSFGRNSLGVYSLGNENSAFGVLSLGSNLLSGSQNTAVGNKSMASNTTGSFDTAIGYQSLYTNTTGTINTANGYQSLFSNTAGNNNTAVGGYSLRANTVGNSNVANGYSALYFNTAGSFNVATGFSALYRNTTGALNTANGSAALYSNTTGYENTATGAGSLYTNSTGYQNVANGLDALYFNTIGTGNVAAGYRTLYNNTSGNHNVANGFRSLYSNTAGVGNIAFGFQSLYSNTTGNTNIAAGSGALYSNTNGQSNIAVGPATLYLNTTGNGNIATGISSLYSNTIGNNNIGFGYRSLYLNTSGNFNIAIGDLALNSNTTGSSNIANGSQALFSNTTGSNNIAIGNQAGYNETGSNKLYIENSNSTTPLIYGEFDNDLVKVYGNIKVDNITTAGNEMQLVNKNNFVHNNGNQIFGSGGDDLILSSQEGSPETAGFYGDGNAVTIWSAGDGNQGQAAALVYFLDEDAFDGANTNPYDNSALKSYITPTGAYVQVSDKNKKENIVKIENASEKIDTISGYTYQFKLSSEEIKKGNKAIVSSGVLAQEIEKVLPEAIQKNEKGEYFVDYAAITPLLIEAIKAQNEKIKTLENSQIEILKRLEKLETK